MSNTHTPPDGSPAASKAGTSNVINEAYTCLFRLERAHRSGLISDIEFAQKARELFTEAEESLAVELLSGILISSITGKPIK
jgi:hypothetical protein